ncbi:MAG: hypothetical protein ACXAEB_06780 [Candidatus Thorarchaeota archaeon]
MVHVSYQHYGILVFPQGVWHEKDIEALGTKIGKAHIEDLYRTNFPTDCDLCNQLKDIFDEIKRNNKGLMYISSAHLWPEAIVKFTNLALDEDKVKKFYFFQGGPVKYKKERVVLRERMTPKRVTKDEFIKVLEIDDLQDEILYEVIRGAYY